MTDNWPGPTQPADQPASDVLDVAPRRRVSRTVAVGIASLTAGVAIGMVGVAAASGDDNSAIRPAALPVQTPPSPSAAPAPTPDDQDVRPFKGRGHQFGKRFGGPLRKLGSVLHGEFVVPGSDGTFQTVHVQRGNVTAVSATSITVKSEDGFTKSYTVNPETLVNAARDGISTVAVNDVVQVHATGTGASPTAASIVDVTKLTTLKERLRPRPSTPTPSPSASVTPSNA
jgi:hypothetical protein